MRFLVAAVGKLKDRALERLCEEYGRRIRPYAPLDVREVKKVEDLPIVSPTGWERILLTERGELMDSRQFADYIGRRRDQGAPGLVFWIGGAEGVPAHIARQATWELSLSPMTFPHRLTRVLLLEQIYRGLTILAGHPYHK